MPYEGLCISVQASRKQRSRRRKTMEPLNKSTTEQYFAALDWASDHHDVVVLNQEGQIVADFRFDHSLVGWSDFAQKMAPYVGAGIALETSTGAAVDQLLQRGWRVYPIHSISAKAYRQRQKPSGTKTDHVDAWALAEALRSEGRQWSALEPEDPLVEQLRLVCRDEGGLIEQRTALINQLKAALAEYYPAALEAFEDWTHAGAWAFILQFPTPQRLVQAGRRAWEKFLHSHKYWRPQTAPQRLEIFARADQFCGRPAVVAAKSKLAQSLARLLQSLEVQLQSYRKEIEKLFEQHPHHQIVNSLPGVGPKLGPRLLAEIAQKSADKGPDPQPLQCLAGTAPISFQSGQIHKTRMRQACDKFFRSTVHLWADLSRRWSPWAQTFYLAHRKQGNSHACAIRCLGHRWLKILWRMWQTKSLYDAELHQRNQLRHGSWVIGLLPKSPVS